MAKAPLSFTFYIAAPIEKVWNGFVSKEANQTIFMGADFDAYLASAAFWIKMALVVGLVANGAVLVRTSIGIAAGDTHTVGRVRAVSIASLTLWFVTTLMGAVLPNVL